MRASSLPNMNLARALVSSVFPTPVGPRKIKEPTGRLGSFNPARERRTALAILSIASSWPMIYLCSSSSICSRRSDSSSASTMTGIPVHIDTISAISSTLTVGLLSLSQAAFKSSSCPSRDFSKFSRSAEGICSSSAFLSSFRTERSLWTTSLASSPIGFLYIRTRDEASSIKSIALSGKNRSDT